MWPSKKPCTKCGEVKDIGEFYDHPHTHDRHLPSCKDCKREYQFAKSLRKRTKLMKFPQAVNDAMMMLAERGAVFVGQSVRYDGAAIYHSLNNVPMTQRIELPVLEDFQMGYCTGLAIAGKLPVCIYPRMDFMLLAANQLVNHLDKSVWNPKVIIRTTVGQKEPLDAGPQHTQNYTRPFQLMLHNIRVDEVRTPDEVRGAYERAINWPNSTLIVENPA